MNQNKNGYFAHENILKLFRHIMLNILKLKKSLVLNTDPLPARPTKKTLLGSFLPNPQIPDSL